MDSIIALKTWNSVYQPTLLCDNQSAVSLSHNPILHARTKHMELDIHFVRERVIDQSLRVQHIPATAQLAVILTKLLSSSQFPTIRSKLNVESFSLPP